jgi:hypothetical protein
MITLATILFAGEFRRKPLKTYPKNIEGPHFECVRLRRTHSKCELLPNFRIDINQISSKMVVLAAYPFGVTYLIEVCRQNDISMLEIFGSITLICNTINRINNRIKL